MASQENPYYNQRTAGGRAEMRRRWGSSVSPDLQRNG